MKTMFTMIFGGKKESLPAETEKVTTAVKSEWIFVDKGNYLMRSLPFSL